MIEQTKNRDPKIHSVVIIIIAMFIAETGLYGQIAPDNYIYISEKEISQLKIKAIDDLTFHDYNSYRCVTRDSLPCSHSFIFDDGNLAKEIYMSSLISKQVAENNAYKYYYDKNHSGQLIIREGSGEVGFSRQQYFMKYVYKNGKLSVSHYGFSYYDQKGDTTTYEVLSSISYYYETSGKLVYINGEVKDYVTDRDNYTDYYLIYRNDSLLGYCKMYIDGIRRYEIISKIMSGVKVESLFSEAIDSNKFDNCIEQCYNVISNSDLLINEIPVKDFLYDKYGVEYQYVVFEIQENRFLFYKIN